MILGRIVGKTSTNNFKFEINGDAKKFDYVQIGHSAVGFVLGQILEIERTSESSIAICSIIGYRDDAGILKGLRTPLEPGNEVLRAEDSFISNVLGLEKNTNGAYMGVLDGRENLKVFIDLEKLLTKHVFITGKSGGGKSYAVGVILEALLDNKVPLVIIDPHGEYNSLSQPNTENIERLARFGLKPKSYIQQIREFSPDLEANPDARAFKLNSKRISSTEMIKMLPTKLSASQLGALYSALKNLGHEASFDDLLFELQTVEDSSAKWTLINMLEYVKKLGLFSDTGTLPSELVELNKCSIINLRGIPPEVQEVIVYKIVTDLFAERKKGNIPPFFLIIEEAQNYCPERGFGEAKSNAILRQVASEGRKFGMGLSIISQRPSRLDKSVISQVSTQIIMKVTNPNDIKAITNSVEGITGALENELQNIEIGTALVTGIIDLPLFVNIRPRKTRHGGEAVKIMLDNSEDDSSAGMILAISPKMTARDIELMSEKPIKVKTILVPCALLRCSQNENEFSLLVNLHEAKIVKDIETGNGIELSKIRLKSLSAQQARIFQSAMSLKKFKPAELFAKAGVQFSDLYDLLTVLMDKGYLEKDNDSYRISGNLEIFSELEKNAVYQKPEFAKISHDEILEKKTEVEKVKELISMFAEVKGIKECFLVRHEIEQPK